MSVLAWQNPPGRANAVISDDILAELKSRPGEWALVRVLRSHNRFKTKCPPGVEVQYRYRVVEGKRVTELYARWKT